MPRAPNRSVGLNPVRMGLSDRARRRWKYAALALAAYLLAQAALGPWLHANNLGGPWYIVEESRWFPEAGFAKYSLYRRGGPRLIKIDRSLSQFRYYPPDCVIYDGYRRPVEHVVFAVCGARVPVAIDRYAGGAVSYTPAGVTREHDANGGPLSQPWLMPIAEIQAVAQTQPPFHAGWERAPLDRIAEVPRVDLR